MQHGGPRFRTFFGRAQIKSLDEKVTYVDFRIFVDFFRLSFLSFCYLFVAVNEFLLGLLPVHELSRV